MARSITLQRSEDVPTSVSPVPHLFVVWRADAPLAPPSRHILDGIDHLLLCGDATGKDT